MMRKMRKRGTVKQVTLKEEFGNLLAEKDEMCEIRKQNYGGLISVSDERGAEKSITRYDVGKL